MNSITNFKNKDMVLTALFFVAVIAFAYLVYTLMRGRRRFGGGSAAGGAMEDDAYTTAKLLHAANAVCYGSKNCGFTVRQMTKFGKNTHLIEYVECPESQNLKCRDVEGFPTWHIGNRVLLGDQPLHALREAADATLRGDVAPPQQQPVQHHESAAPAPQQAELAGMGGDAAYHPTL